MTSEQYDKIMLKIYENGRVTDPDGISEETEFHFEARQQGFSDEEILIAHSKFRFRFPSAHSLVASSR